MISRVRGAIISLLICVSYFRSRSSKCVSTRHIDIILYRICTSAAGYIVFKETNILLALHKDHVILVTRSWWFTGDLAPYRRNFLHRSQDLLLESGIVGFMTHFLDLFSAVHL